MKALFALLLLGGLAWFGYRHFAGPITYPAGILVAAEPEQYLLLAAETPPITHGEFQLQPLANFCVEGRVLQRRNYRFDAGAKLAPTDLAIGWGPMSDQTVLDRLSISQSMRFYFYEYRDPPPIPPGEIILHSGNLHIIPADYAIQRACASLRTGELVRLEGQLVEASAEGMSAWRSSLRRDDTGKGACELFFVERMEKLQPGEVGKSLQAAGP